MAVSELSRNALVTHLHGLTEERLAALGAARRDLTAEPLPGTLTQLANRMVTGESLLVACAGLSRAEMQLAEVVAALGDGWTVARAAALIAVPPNDSALTTAIARLSELTLIWPVRGGFAGAHLEEIWPRPLELGPAAAQLLGDMSVPELRKLADEFGVAAGRLKRDLVSAVAEWLSDADNVRAVLTAASPADRRRLRALADELPDWHGVQDLPWAVDHGLLLPAGWGRGGQMPREVALVMRGEDFRAPFDGEPPAFAATTVDPEAVARDAAAAVTETLAAVTALLEAIGRAPVSLLKTGGLGIRELRRLAKDAGQDEARTRFVVELATAGGLAHADEDGLTPADIYDGFAAEEPGERLMALIEDWLAMPACPLAPARPGEPAERALYWDPEEEALLITLRSGLLRTIERLTGDGQAITGEILAAQFAWQLPVMAESAGNDFDRFVAGIWREAHALGLLARGTPTRLCRLLLADRPDEAREVAATMVPAARATVVLQNDLTAVVTGTPSAALLSLLDRVADPESRSGAWTWRFSPASVRRAFDGGAGATELLERLGAVAEGGRLPQVLSYLVEDVARRHGRVRVQPAGCCLCSDDEALLTEILHTRSLASLRLVRLAPTVLASAEPEAKTLAALRAAGFAPSGTGAVERIPQRRAPEPVDEWEPPRREIQLAAPADFAARLVRSV